jgi:transcriptional regulator with XRE-family HTH domain/tetratricopeptide (TPR) repeat protein
MVTSDAGDLIYQQRRQRGWSKARLCEEIQSWEYRHGNEETLGLNPYYVREWERGERSVSDHYAPKLAAVLELPIEVFVDRRSRRGRVLVLREDRVPRPAPPTPGGSDSAVPALPASTTSPRDRLVQHWSDLALLGPLGQRLLDKILEPQRTLMVDRRTMLRLLGAGSVAASLELLGSDAAAAFEPFDFEPTTVNVLESLALRYQALYHSTPPTELMVPVSAHLELVDDLAKQCSGATQQRVLRNHSQVALLAGRLAFFDLRDPMSARAYYGVALDSSREASDPHLAAATLGHMSFIPAASGGFHAAADLLEGATESAAKATVLPSWLASVEAEIQAQAGQIPASLAAIDRAECSLSLGHEVPAWMDYYDMTRLQGFKGYAYLKAGKPDEARTALGEALSALDGHAVKQRAVFLTDLATTSVHEGEVDKGAEVAAEAADALTAAVYATSAERLHEFRELVQPWQDRASVKELDERLALV